MRKPWYTHLYVRSPITKLLIGIVSVGAGIILLALLGIAEPTRMAAQTDNWEARGVEKGATLFKDNCASCHGDHGQGGAAPALNSRYFFTQRLDDLGYKGTMEDYVTLTVAAGRPSKITNQWNQVMATWGAEYGGPLRQDQVENVARYVMNWESTALQQTQAEDPWIPFEDTPSKATPEEVYADADADGGEATPAGPRPPEELFTSMGCAGCHNLELLKMQTTVRPVGPNMGNLAENAAVRIEGLSAEEYVYQSIIDPNSFIVDSYFANVMTQNFSTMMTEEEIRGLVAWLLDAEQ